MSEFASFHTILLAPEKNFQRFKISTWKIFFVVEISHQHFKVQHSWKSDALKTLFLDCADKKSSSISKYLKGGCKSLTWFHPTWIYYLNLMKQSSNCFLIYTKKNRNVIYFLKKLVSPFDAIFQHCYIKYQPFVQFDLNPSVHVPDYDKRMKKIKVKVGLWLSSFGIRETSGQLKGRQKFQFISTSFRSNNEKLFSACS